METSKQHIVFPMNVFGLFQVEFLCYEIMEISIFVKAHCEDSELIILLIIVYMFVCLIQMMPGGMTMQ